MLDYIYWDVNPNLIHTSWLTIRYYGLFFALGFLISQQIMIWIFKQEGKSEKHVETLTIYMIIATVIGARLGHCLFYDPGFYLSNPIEILLIWKGGLASHGAAIGILIAIYLYSQKVTGQSYMWLLDRLVIVIAFTGGLIRLGNLMNSEIVGIPTDVPWAFVFKQIDLVPRHPVQLYESISAFIIFGLLLSIYLKKKAELPKGRLFGLFLIILFSVRFVLEYFKRHQAAFADDIPLRMGQILSLPLVIAGIFILYRSYQRGKVVT